MNAQPPNQDFLLSILTTLFGSLFQTNSGTTLLSAAIAPLHVAITGLFIVFVLYGVGLSIVHGAASGEYGKAGGYGNWMFWLRITLSAGLIFPYLPGNFSLSQKLFYISAVVGETIADKTWSVGLATLSNGVLAIPIQSFDAPVGQWEQKILAQLVCANVEQLIAAESGQAPLNLVPQFSENANGEATYQLDVPASLAPGACGKTVVTMPATTASQLTAITTVKQNEVVTSSTTADPMTGDPFAAAAVMATVDPATLNNIHSLQTTLYKVQLSGVDQLYGSLAGIAQEIARAAYLRREGETDMRVNPPPYPNPGEYQKIIGDWRQTMLEDAAQAIKERSTDLGDKNGLQVYKDMSDKFGWVVSATLFSSLEKYNSQIADATAWGGSATGPDAQVLCGNKGDKLFLQYHCGGTFGAIKALDSWYQKNVNNASMNINSLDQFVANNEAVGYYGEDKSAPVNVSQWNVFSNMTRQIEDALLKKLNFAQIQQHPITGFLALGQSLMGYSLLLIGGGALTSAIPFTGPTGTFAMGLGVSLLTFGAVAAFWIPTSIFLRVFMSAIAWLLIVCECILFCPLWCLAMTSPSDSLHGGHAKMGWSLLLEAAVRPALTVLGLLSAIALFDAIAPIGFGLSRVMMSGASQGNPAGLMALVFHLLVIVGLAIILFEQIASQIAKLPQHGMRWLGSTAGNDIGDNHGGLRDLVGGAGIAGAAGSIGSAAQSAASAISPDWRKPDDPDGTKGSGKRDQEALVPGSSKPKDDGGSGEGGQDTGNLAGRGASEITSQEIAGASLGGNAGASTPSGSNPVQSSYGASAPASGRSSGSRTHPSWATTPNMTASDHAAASQAYQRWAAENYGGEAPFSEASYVGYVRDKAAQEMSGGARQAASGSTPSPSNSDRWGVNDTGNKDADNADRGPTTTDAVPSSTPASGGQSTARDNALRSMSAQQLESKGFRPVENSGGYMMRSNPGGGATVALPGAQIHNLDDAEADEYTSAVAERGEIGGQRALNRIEANRANEALAGGKNSTRGEQ